MKVFVTYFSKAKNTKKITFSISKGASWSIEEPEKGPDKHQSGSKETLCLQ